MKKIILLLFLFIFLIGCNKESELEMILTKDNYIIVDVRTEDEYNESHIKKAINIPYDEIDDKVNLDKTKTILVYCKSGKRSSIAYNTLKSLGYDAKDLGAFDNINLEKE